MTQTQNLLFLNNISDETKINIFLCGQTGAGKSSIVNYILKENLAKNSDTNVTTKGIKSYHKGDLGELWDSDGYEINNQEHYKSLLHDYFKLRTQNNYDEVLLTWFVVNGATKRFTSYDQQLVELISKKAGHIAIVVNKIDELSSSQLSQFKDSIKKQNPEGNIFLVSTKAVENSELITFCEWDALFDWTYKIGNSGNTVIRLLQQRAESGDTEAQKELSILFESKNAFLLAIKYIKLAANAGDKAAWVKMKELAIKHAISNQTKS
ncbi:MAG: GTPase domain-containing protein [Fusobacteriaceae bacterium]|jgi:GTP-binding protein EngB required for normal cell division|nr:GTPase domain-containing protein [Fusobacteriaceae bacterium]